MDDFTIISYPGSRNDTLLSLSSTRSKYMIPFGGKFRVVDFTIGNSNALGASRTIIYSNYEDELEEYVERYGPFKDMNFPPIKVVSREYSDIQFCYNLVLDSNTNYYIIYNGDNPSIIDFASLIKKYRSSRKGAVLYKLKFDERASMAYTVLIINQKSLLNIINKAVDDKRESPNIFEMVINLLLNKHIVTDVFEVEYWPLKNIPDYYSSNIEILRDPELFSLLYKKLKIISQIKTEGYANIGTDAKIMNSFISDGCDINGTVKNSIIFPGVEIGDKAIVEDSIILPFARIGAEARIMRSVIDEGTDSSNSEPEIDTDSDADSGTNITTNTNSNIINIGNRCRIGSEDMHIKNNDYPRSVFSSITFIGKDCEIPEGSVIGGACYIQSGLGKEYFSNKKYLHDGLSIAE